MLNPHLKSKYPAVYFPSHLPAKQTNIDCITRTISNDFNTFALKEDGSNGF